MNTNSRYAVAIHVLVLLAFRREERVTSEYIACSVMTNPVVIRRILGDLRRAGLVESQSGSGGGWKLCKPPEQITLAETYQAMKESALFALHPKQPNKQCAIGRTIQQALTGIFAEAEAALEAQFARTTVADVLHRIQTPP